jgi:hypothetical protein
MAVDGAYLLHCWVFRLFLGGLALAFALIALAGWLQVQIHPLIGLVFVVSIIVFPALALSGYIVVRFGLAIAALVKVLRTNWSLRA